MVARAKMVPREICVEIRRVDLRLKTMLDAVASKSEWVGHDGPPAASAIPRERSREWSKAAPRTQHRTWERCGSPRGAAPELREGGDTGFGASRTGGLALAVARARARADMLV